MCGISTDITSRKRAEQELKESKDRIGQIIDQALDAFVSMDSAGIVTAWNRSAEEIFGWPAHKAIGKALSELIVPERYRAAHERGLQRFLETGKGPLLDKHVELLAVHRDGHEFPVELSVTAVKVRGGFMFHAIPARHHRPQGTRARDPAAHRAARRRGRGTGLAASGSTPARSRRRHAAQAIRHARRRRASSRAGPRRRGSSAAPRRG